MDDFVPMNGTVSVPQVAPPAQLTVDQRAATEFVKVAGDQRLIGLMLKSAQMQVYLRHPRIENQAQYDQAIDAFDAAKKVIKDAEDLRHEWVDLPTKLVSMINETFKKNVKDPIEVVKAHLGRMIDVKKGEDAAAAQRIQQQQVELAASGQPVVGEDGRVQVGAVEVQTPGNVVSSARGAKVHSRTETIVTITDLTAFLKIVCGTNKRFDWLQAHLDELVEVKIGVLKRLILEKGKVKSIPGVEIEKGTKTV
jgi:hypothetical protein